MPIHDPKKRSLLEKLGYGFFCFVDLISRNTLTVFYITFIVILSIILNRL